MVRAIIFDCFGVLTTEGWLNFKQKHFGNKSELAKQATDLNKQTNLGLISYDDFLQKVSELANVSKREAHEAMGNNVPNEPLLEYIATLKPKYKIASLSNASANWFHELFKPDQIKLFGELVLSYETGAVKPEPRAYEIAAKRLGVNIGECVFVDDQERYCVAAREVGMQAIWYKDFDQMKAELEKILANSKS